MTVTQLDSKTYVFDEGGVRFFLLIGSQKAALIDSGMQTKNAKDLAREYTSLPVILINTHADRDHTGSNSQFDSFYMSPAECSNYYRGGGTGDFLPIWDGDIIDLGERPLKIISLPGHTPGSVGILDINYKRLFSGDPVQDGRIFMFGVQREFHAYVGSLERLLTVSDSFDEIYPSHGSLTVPKDIIPKLIGAAKDILDGKAKGSEQEVFGGKVTLYDFGFAAFLSDI